MYNHEYDLFNLLVSVAIICYIRTSVCNTIVSTYLAHCHECANFLVIYLPALVFWYVYDLLLGYTFIYLLRMWMDSPVFNLELYFTIKFSFYCSYCAVKFLKFSHILVVSCLYYTCFNFRTSILLASSYSSLLLNYHHIFNTLKFNRYICHNDFLYVYSVFYLKQIKE